MSGKTKPMSSHYLTLPSGLHYVPETATPTQRIAALEADVARLQWQMAKLLVKPRKRKGGRK